MPVKLTNTEFVKKAQKIHGNKYNYSHVSYVNNDSKVSIICKKHGEFFQTPSGHLSGNGCRKCFYKGLSSNADVFIKRSKSVHGNKYDYSEVIYIKNSFKVKIICPDHGAFYVTPSNHINGDGCQECWKNQLSEDKSYLTTEDFVEKSTKIHNHKYYYYLTNYINSKTPVDIVCPYHGIFKQNPTNHLKGNGCVQCARVLKKEQLSMSTQEFIKKANSAHKNQYGYNGITYTGNQVKVGITCKKHGIFNQTPSNHLRGSGCPHCIRSEGEEKIKDYLISNGIIFEMGKKFPGCRYKNLLSFDFYIPSFNIAIEFDGRQHFNQVSFGSSKKESVKEKFEKTQIRDRIKNDFCRLKGINLIRIPFYYIDKIKDILNSNLNLDGDLNGK